MKRVVLPAAAVLGSLLTAVPYALADAISKGEAILSKQCLRCHAIGATGESTHATAPPFRQIVTRYPLDNLAESMAEGLSTGHPDMPEFVFAPDEIEAILSYMSDLKAKTATGEAKPEGMQ